MNKKQLKDFNEKKKLKSEIEQAQKDTTAALQFLVDIGTKKNRAKYKGSNKELMNQKAQIINYMFGQIALVRCLGYITKKRDMKWKFLKRKSRYTEAEELIKELFK